MIDSLPPNQLRWSCDPESLPFETTAEVEPTSGIVGQSYALEALRFGLECNAPGQNVYVRGLSGTGRMSMVRRLLDELNPVCQIKADRCYVHNFSEPERPRLISLPPGQARPFRKRVRELAEFIFSGLPDALNADPIRARRNALQEEAQKSINAQTKPLEEELTAAGLALVSIQSGPITQTAIFPRVDGQPVPPDQYEQLHQQGQVTQEQLEHFAAQRDRFQSRLEEVTSRVAEIYRQGAERIQEYVEAKAREILRDASAPIREGYREEAVACFLDELVEDVVENRLGGQETEGDELRRLYSVNVLLEHEQGQGCPVVVENTPSLANLLGTVDPEWSAHGPIATDHRRIRAGSLLRADGGYLILEARDVLLEPGAWKVLLRTLRTGLLEIVPPELGSPYSRQSLKPQPIPIRVRVILVGDAHVFHALDQNDPDFPEQFKVLADFDSMIDREPDGLLQYAGVLARIARDEELPPFDRSAVAALAEQGARIVARRGKLTARFGRVADIAREAAFLAGHKHAERVVSDDVHAAITRTKARANLPSRRFQDLLVDGTIRVATRGEVVGQINGLAVISAGPITYGFPARITATIGPGTAGVIDIEGRSAMSGSIHTKGFQILGGLLRHLLRVDHALAFSASLAFEQSYGGIDGDSASGAEICCLLSALTDVPIRQNIAITGAIDQLGHVQAIGGVNEKIEGFFDTCRHFDLSGDQGVIIPRANAGDLMLRRDVVEVCRAGKFHVYAVETVQEALEILTGLPVGELHDGVYPEGSLLDLAMQRATEFWLKTSQSPVFLEEEADGAEGEAEPAPGAADGEDDEDEEDGEPPSGDDAVEVPQLR